MFAWLRQRFATRQNEKRGNSRGYHNFLPIHFPFQHFGETDLRRNSERFANGSATEIAINQQGAGTGESHSDSKIGRDRRLAFARDRAGDQKAFWSRALIRHEENRRANVSIRFGKHMPRVVRLEQIHFALRFFLWNLPKNVFGKVMLEFAE